MNNRIAETYATISTSDLALIDFSQIHETSENTIRKSLDDSQFVIKYNQKPSFISNGSVVPLRVMTHSEASMLMRTPAWSIEEDIV
tara:strand:- start:29 stop:286 length:258 start_codon:yes stop_codon:yes gene_type:complete